MHQIFAMQVEMDIAEKKDLECEFHSLNYHKMMDVVTGLRIAMEYLIKVCEILQTFLTITFNILLRRSQCQTHQPKMSAAKKNLNI